MQKGLSILYIFLKLNFATFKFNLVLLQTCTNLQWPRSQKGRPSCNFSKLHFAKFIKLYFLTILHFWKHAVCQTKSKSMQVIIVKCIYYAMIMRFPTHVHTQCHTHTCTHTHTQVGYNKITLLWWHKLTPAVIIRLHQPWGQLAYLVLCQLFKFWHHSHFKLINRYYKWISLLLCRLIATESDVTSIP